MANSYISRFINSKDIRTYLDETGHEFSVTEYAFLIWQCRNLPLHERHDEFRKFIDTTESVIIKTSTCRDGWDLHRTILEYINMEERMIDSLKNNSDKCFYTAEWSEDNDWRGGKCSFIIHHPLYTYNDDYGLHTFPVQTDRGH